MPMPQRHILTIAAVLTALPLALTGCTTIVATPVTPTTTAPTAEPIEVDKPTNEPIPPASDFTTVYDDSGIVSVNVPSTWTDVVGAQLTNSSGVVFYNVTASPDIAAWQSGWDVPGVSVSSTQDPSIVIEDIINGTIAGPGAECDAAPETGDYDDGVYVGTYVYFENCGGVGTDYVSIVARDADKNVIICTIQMVSDEDKSTVRDEILNSFWAIY
jgi:serine protease Do